MPRQKADLEKVTIRLHAGDSGRLQTYFPLLGYNAAIRELVRNSLRQLDERAQRQAKFESSPPVPDLNLENRDG